MIGRDSVSWIQRQRIILNNTCFTFHYAKPLRMLPLSTWSWQDSIKSVLSGKAVVVDIYPNIFVRAVSLDMPVPSVIALREYAPAGKAVSSLFLKEYYLVQFSILLKISTLSSLPPNNNNTRNLPLPEETSFSEMAIVANIAVNYSAHPTSHWTMSSLVVWEANSRGKIP